MANPKLPNNQINSLPLLTPENAADPGQTITVVGNRAVRYWTPTALGISEAPPAVLGNPNGYGNRGFVTNPIDLSGMTTLLVQIKRRITAAAGDEGAPIVSIFLQQMYDPVPAGDQIFAAQVGASIRGTSLVLIDTAQFAAVGANPFPDIQIAQRGMPLDQLRGNGAVGGTGNPGPMMLRARLWLDWNTALVPGNQFWSCSLIGMS